MSEVESLKNKTCRSHTSTATVAIMPEAEELSIKLLIRSRIETWLTVSTSNEM